MSDWTNIIQYSFQTVWVEFISVLPQILVAILVLVVGWIIAGALKSVVQRVFARLKVDSALDAAGVDTLAQRAGYQLNSGAFVGTLVKWFIIVVFFVAALDILNLSQATAFLSQIVLGYIPQVIVGVLILFGGLILASVAKKMVVASVTASSLGSSELLGKFTYYAIVLFTAVAALNQLAIAPEMMQMLFAGLVFGLSLAFGLAFGLGGRDAAASYLKQVTKGDSHHHGQH
jgi:hypothetical protein